MLNSTRLGSGKYYFWWEQDLNQLPTQEKDANILKGWTQTTMNTRKKLDWIYEKYTLVILNVINCFHRFPCVRSHHIVVHKSRSSKKAETSGAAEDTPSHVLCCFLQPMTDGVFKLLVPNHRPWYTTLNRQMRHRWLQLNYWGKGRWLGLITPSLFA